MLEDDDAANDNVGIPPTELARARQHLRKRQEELSRARAYRPLRGVIADAILKRIENEVLAALSWVWDAQERASGPTIFILRSLPGPLHELGGKPSTAKPFYGRG